MSRSSKEVFYHGKDFTKDFGYAQAVTVGSTLYISGTVSLDDEGKLVAPGDIRGQTRRIYEDLQRILEVHGVTFSDVIKEAIFTTDIDRFKEEAMPVRAEFYQGHTLPASSAWLQVSRLAFPEFLVEIEAIAVLP
ncbi:RidA family protein [Thermosynechococcaceae cyanobacterium BACA0444]|uniref:RidA family protein n=1 Tax=Pseudocalidococcus azoricus BACA0444 TaxID=2918990 RepID=A0AAE4FVS9_9CYAN|nr:RidA family protein [Pseudocalidococcus azoricus]MDS3862432.1 RidA family protein [Pseudocalidococcus azoricus BACA0444]